MTPLFPVIWAPAFQKLNYDRNTHTKHVIFILPWEKKERIFSQEYAEGDRLRTVSLASLLILLKTLIGILTGSFNWRPHTSFTVLLFVITHSLGNSHHCDESIFKRDFSSIGRGTSATDNDASKPEVLCCMLQPAYK